MKLTEQELQNIAGDCAVELWTYESHWTYGKYKREILKALDKVRDPQEEKQVKIELVASEGPSFGGYCRGECEDGEAIIAINLKLCLINDKNPKGFLSEVLAHEVLHACQDLMGNQLTESDINAALASMTGEEYISCESEEQIQQEQLRMIQELGVKLEIAREALKSMAAWLDHGDLDSPSKEALIAREALEKIKY